MPKHTDNPTNCNTDRDNVCADCGMETTNKDGPCISCGGMRIVLISFVEEHFGKDWRDAFEPDRNPT